MAYILIPAFRLKDLWARMPDGFGFKDAPFCIVSLAIWVLAKGRQAIRILAALELMVARFDAGPSLAIASAWP